MGLNVDITTRRMLADFIDYFLIALILVMCGVSELPSWVFSLDFKISVVPVSLPSFGFFIISLPIVFKDFVFGNAGIGKKIMGLVIVDKDNQKPTTKVLIKRGIIMPLFGSLMFAKYSGTKNGFEDWEMRKIGTKVIAKKDLEKCDKNE